MSSTSPPPARWLLRLAVLALPLVALVPVGTLVVDWLEVSRLVGAPLEATPPRGFDWTRWDDRDGDIVADYVDPRGTAFEAGLRPGDVLFSLDGQQFFNADDVERGVAGLPPGAMVVYDVVRGGVPIMLEVTITRFPTFVYPLSEALWQVSLWGFAVAAFLTVLALGIVAPLSVRSRRTWGAVALLGAATVWAAGHGLRLAMLTLAGPPLSSAYTLVFRTLTVVSLAGWIVFPALLLFVVLGASPGRLVRRGRWLVFLPAAVLGLGVLLDSLVGEFGPVTTEALIAPILFYVCCYVATATGLSLLDRRHASAETDAGPAVALGWSRAGSLAVFAVAAAGALFALGVAPQTDAATDLRAGWLVVALQVLSLMPVGLVTAATLRYGKTDMVPRGLTYLAGLGTLFFVFVAGLEGLRRVYAPAPVPSVGVGLWLVGLLLLAERALHLLRRRLGGLLLTERQRARRRLDRFSERVRHILQPQRLADETARDVGEALDVSSVAVFLRSAETDDEADAWLEGSYHRRPPYFTRRHLDVLLHSPGDAVRVWTRNPELNERPLPPSADRRLRDLGLALAVPVVVNGSEASSGAPPLGMLVLGPKRARRAVFSLDDVEQLKALAAQLALALERLRLVEREKALVRQHAEAQLTALRAQINPHFLFNALNTIAALIAERPAEAEANVERLARIFRHVLATSGQPFVPLHAEVRLVREYLALERARFGHRLRVEVDVPEALDDLPVPAFALQTLAENAVKHGIERQRGGGAVTLRAARETDADGNAALVLTVADTGAGLAPPVDPDDPTAFYGVGLRNVRDRLRQLYERDDLLRVAGALGAGTTATLRLPLDASPSPPLTQPAAAHG